MAPLRGRLPLLITLPLLCSGNANTALVITSVSCLNEMGCFASHRRNSYSGLHSMTRSGRVDPYSGRSCPSWMGIMAQHGAASLSPLCRQHLAVHQATWYQGLSAWAVMGCLNLQLNVLTARAMCLRQRKLQSHLVCWTSPVQSNKPLTKWCTPREIQHWQTCASNVLLGRTSCLL